MALFQTPLLFLLVHLLVAFHWAQIGGLNDSHLALFQTTCCCCCCCCFAHSTWEQSHLPTTNLATHTTSCSKPISMAWLCFKPQKKKQNKEPIRVFELIQLQQKNYEDPQVLKKNTGYYFYILPRAAVKQWLCFKPAKMLHYTLLGFVSSHHCRSKLQKPCLGHSFFTSWSLQGIDHTSMAFWMAGPHVLCAADQQDPFSIFHTLQV